jgi:hypothetical protein
VAITFEEKQAIIMALARGRARNSRAAPNGFEKDGFHPEEVDGVIAWAERRESSQKDPMVRLAIAGELDIPSIKGQRMDMTPVFRWSTYDEDYEEDASTAPSGGAETTH